MGGDTFPSTTGLLYKWGGTWGEGHLDRVSRREIALCLGKTLKEMTKHFTLSKRVDSEPVAKCKSVRGSRGMLPQEMLKLFSIYFCLI